MNAHTSPQSSDACLQAPAARRALLPRLAGLTLALAIALPVSAQAPAFDANGTAGTDGQVQAPMLKDVVATDPAIELKPGEYLWNPDASPAGPLVVRGQPARAARARVPQRRAHRRVDHQQRQAGHETPTGVFPILQKRKEHYSNLYNNAPMPFMQRLTWDGIALHGGRIPGHPASHGCVRLPHEFARKLFDTTEHGSTVVVADTTSHGTAVVYPGDRAPIDAITGLPLDTMDAMAVAHGGGEVTASLK